MKLTTIKQQVKNPDRVSLFVDGKYSFSLSLSELLQERLKQGEELDEPRLKALQKLSADGKLRGRTLEWLMSRPHSTREFKDYLVRKKADADQIERWQEEFTTKQYLDDAAFARWLAGVRRKRGKSNRAIRADLFKKGVPRDIVEEIMAESSADDQESSEQERLKVLAVKKAHLPRYQADPAKLIQFLQRQGFNYDDIKTVLAEFAENGD